MDKSERFDAYRKHLGAQGFTAATTVTDRLEVLNRVTRDLGHPTTLTEHQLASWLADGRCRDGSSWSNSTKANYYNHINGYLQWEVDEGTIEINPLWRIKKAKIPKGKPRPTRQTLWQRIIAEAVHPWRTAGLLAGLGGLRACEIWKLDRQEIDEENILIIEGKGGYTDEVGTHEMIWEAVRDLPLGPVIRNRFGKRYSSAKSLSTRFAQEMRRLGIYTSLHPLRHRFGSDMRKQYDLRVVQKAMRHRNLNTTEIYTDLDGAEVRAAIQSLRPAA
jgi:integrase